MKKTPLYNLSNEEILQKIVMPLNSASVFLSNTEEEIYCNLSIEQKNALQRAENHMDRALALIREALPTSKSS